MFFDNFSATQQYDFEMPIISEFKHIVVESSTGEQKSVKQPKIKHRGSYDSKIDILLRDNTLMISGNPSRYNRQDNLFGLSNVDSCVSVYNEILESLKLPPLTKCTKIMHLQGEDSSRVSTISDGAMLTRTDTTTNRSVGKGCELEYIRAISTIPYKRQMGYLFPNGNGCTWLNKSGKAGNRQYNKVYGKATEMEIHLLPKVKKQFGANSSEYKYVCELRNYCKEEGVVRFEQELKRDFLRENNMMFYGLIDENKFAIEHEDFMNIDEKLQVSKMDIEHVTETLLRKNICTSAFAANTTASYFYRWMNCEQFDFVKSAPRLHASRLNKIGINIRMPFDSSRHSPVIVRQAKIITPTYLAIPSWYKKSQSNLRLVA